MRLLTILTCALVLASSGMASSQSTSRNIFQPISGNNQQVRAVMENGVMVTHFAPVVFAGPTPFSGGVSFNYGAFDSNAIMEVGAGHETGKAKTMEGVYATADAQGHITVTPINLYNVIGQSALYVVDSNDQIIGSANLISLPLETYKATGGGTAYAVGVPGGEFFSHLSVLVTNAAGQPVPAVVVTFTCVAAAGECELDPASPMSLSTTVTTDAHGIAMLGKLPSGDSVHYRSPTPGTVTLKVTVPRITSTAWSLVIQPKGKGNTF